MAHPRSPAEPLDEYPNAMLPLCMWLLNPRVMHLQGPMPLDKESFMNGKLGLGMAIPEDATAKLGPLPALPTGARQAGREFEVGLHCPPCKGNQ